MKTPEDGRSIPVAVKDITAGGIQINQAKEGRSWGGQKEFNLSYNIYVYFSYWFLTNKHSNAYTDTAQIFSGASHDPREGLWMIKIKKICLKNFELKKYIYYFKIKSSKSEMQKDYTIRWRGYREPKIIDCSVYFLN